MSGPWILSIEHNWKSFYLFVFNRALTIPHSTCTKCLRKPVFPNSTECGLKNWTRLWIDITLKLLRSPQKRT
jgi:hypothetical protein